MNQIEKNLIFAYHKKMELLGQCRTLLERKSIILMHYDLASLESILAEEALQISQLEEIEVKIELYSRKLAKELDINIDKSGWPKLKKLLGSDSEKEIDGMRSELENLISDIILARQKCYALIENGRHFTQAMLSAIYPPETYNKENVNIQAPKRNILSVEC